MCLTQISWGSNQNGGPWFAGITVPAAPDWNEGNLLSVNILERNDKAITACEADWKGETGCLVKDTNQYQAQMESDDEMGHILKVTITVVKTVSHSDSMKYSMNVERLTMMLCVFDCVHDNLPLMCMYNMYRTHHHRQSWHSTTPWCIGNITMYYWMWETEFVIQSFNTFNATAHI